MSESLKNDILKAAAQGRQSNSPKKGKPNFGEPRTRIFCRQDEKIIEGVKQSTAPKKIKNNKNGIK